MKPIIKQKKANVEDFKTKFYLFDSLFLSVPLAALAPQYWWGG